MRIAAFSLVVSMAIFNGTLGAQQHPSARDSFWSASDLVSVSTNPGAKAARAATPRHKPPVPVPNSGPHVNPVLVAENGYGEAPHLVRVSNDAIGLRYSLLLRGDDGRYAETSPMAAFHSGDHIRLSVMANQPGYLYVIQQGSSGSWSPIFPAPKSATDANHVEQGKVYQVPDGKGAFSFEPPSGQEKLFIVLSRTPIPDLQNTIQGLKNPESARPAPAQPPSMAVYEASNRIPDALVQSLKGRDLSLVQEVDYAPSGDSSGEKAVYVVSSMTASGAGAQVVASVTLAHQ